MLLHLQDSRNLAPSIGIHPFQRTHIFEVSIMHLKKFFAASISATVILFATSAMAQVTDIGVTSNPDAFAGHVVNDISIDFTGQYTGSQLYVELTQGTIYQDALGSALAPNSAFFPVFPSLEFDTFVAQGGSTAATTNGVIALGGGAVNLADVAQNPDNLGRPIPSSSTFSTTLINQQYNPSAGLIISNQSDFLTARITLSNDAMGEIVFAGFASPDATNPVSPNVAPRLNLPIVNGVIGGGGPIIPEPSTVILLGMGLIGLVAMKRRTR
jgi:hypothetical protein